MISRGDRSWIPWVPETFLARFPVSVESLLWPARFSRGFAARSFGLRRKMCRPSTNTENSHRTREEPLVPTVGYERWQHQTRKQTCCSPSEIAKSLWTFLHPPLGISVVLRFVREASLGEGGRGFMDNFWNYTHFSFVWAKWLTYCWALVCVACITDTLNSVSVGAGLYLNRNDFKRKYF